MLKTALGVKADKRPGASNSLGWVVQDLPYELDPALQPVKDWVGRDLAS